MGLGRHKFFICRISLSVKVENRVIILYIRNRTAEAAFYKFCAVRYRTETALINFV